MLALVGRPEVRDWVDVIASDERLQPLGYLAWAACAKDPRFNPTAILEGAARSGRYSAEEVRQLAYEGEPPDAARQVIPLLPAEEVGSCVLDRRGTLFRGSASELKAARVGGGLVFHRGRLRGALPRLKT